MVGLRSATRVQPSQMWQRTGGGVGVGPIILLGRVSGLSYSLRVEEGRG